MNIKMKKLMSLLMCCVMLFGMLPVEAFATETGAETGIAAEENVAEVPAEVAPSADEPLVEEPLVEDPVVEEPVAEERVVEELVFEEVVKVEKILDAEGPSLAETFLSRIRELQAKAEALAEKEVVSNEDCAEIYNDLMKINDEVIAAKAAGTITSEEYDAVYSAIGSVMMVLAGYGFDPYAAEAIADLTIPQGSSADYKASGVNGNTKFTISPDTDDIKVERTGR